MMKRRKRSWIVDALSALACAEVDGLESLLLGDVHVFFDINHYCVGSGLRGEELWGRSGCFYCVWRFGSGVAAGAERVTS